MDILVVGQGSVLSACAKILRANGAVFSVVEPKEPLPLFSITPHLKELGIPVLSLSPTELVELIRRAVHPLLVFSIVNKVLFPPDITEREDITIVNYHNAGLPGHRGRNCEAWQIYEREISAGVTWHYVDAGVDTGAVIRQSTIPLLPDMTSIQLLTMQGREAVRLFQEMLPSLLSDGTKQKFKKKRYNAVYSPLHYSWERPNNGKLDLFWTASRIWAFLRAMDYGVLNTLGTPVVQWNCIDYTWRKYIREGFWRDDARGKIDLNGSDLVFSFATGRIILQGCVT